MFRKNKFALRNPPQTCYPDDLLNSIQIMLMHLKNSKTKFELFNASPSSSTIWKKMPKYILSDLTETKINQGCLIIFLCKYIAIWGQDDDKNGYFARILIDADNTWVKVNRLKPKWTFFQLNLLDFLKELRWCRPFWIFTIKRYGRYILIIKR